ncbi:HAD family phosphatase [Egibacter rhizosphaerae]|uniref:HAD family phosphatase n=1 Tax=Egibacter rhizosphaerae TaxID=1670831 RepID=A0A411YKF4_9ACTN|nr:HAD family phosphatase [Egibacter rhizosphaerae]QBI21660.1 HAD family phosphatase [Egibacter rhizosphaerae]
MAPTAVVFDVGGVLLDWDPRHLYRKLIPDRDEREWFLAHVCNPEWNAQQDRGRPFVDAIAERQAAFPAYRELIAAYWERWDEMLGGPLVGTVAVLDQLERAGVACYALTNFSNETWPRAFRRYPWLGRFAGIVISGRERVVKPDVRIYQRLIARYWLDPAETVLIDDRPENVAAAERIGFQALQFVSPIGLREDLRSHGLSV